MRCSGVAAVPASGLGASGMTTHSTIQDVLRRIEETGEAVLENDEEALMQTELRTKPNSDSRCAPASAATSSPLTDDDLLDNFCRTNDLTMERRPRGIFYMMPDRVLVLIRRS